MVSPTHSDPSLPPHPPYPVQGLKDDSGRSKCSSKCLHLRKGVAQGETADDNSKECLKEGQKEGGREAIKLQLS